MKTRLVSFLGLGPEKAPEPYYTSVSYQLEGSPSVSAETPLVQRALCELLGPIDSIVLIGTSEAESRWITSGRFEEYSGRAAHFERIPSGANEAERWAIFECVAKTLSRSAFERESGSPDRIVLDVTHGYRAHPLLGMAAVTFVLSEWERDAVQPPPLLQIVYGAFEASRSAENRLAPIWDITQFVTASRWNQALDALLRFGRADQLAALAALDAKEQVEAASASGVRGKALGAAQVGKRLGRAARDFADDLALARLASLVKTSIPRLERELSSDDVDGIVARIPVLRPMVDRLCGQLGTMSATTLCSRPGLRATAQVADYYGSIQRFSEQAATLREALVTQFGLEQGDTTLEPGTPGFDEQRRSLDEGWGGAASQYGSDNAARRLDSEVQAARNDVQHCGMKSQPRSAASLRAALQDYSKRLSELVGKPSRTFLNVSNHPSADWSESQRAGVLELGYEEVMDLAFVNVPPTATTEEVEALAATVLDQILAVSPGAVHVAGEPTLVGALVPRLQACGLPCYAATTERKVQESADRSESVREFRFVAWRKYPSAHRPLGD